MIMYFNTFLIGAIFLTFSVNAFTASKFDDPDFEDTVFVCEEKLIPHVTRQALEMPAAMQSEMNRSYQRQKKREELRKERETQEAMEDAFTLTLETNFPLGPQPGEVRVIPEDENEFDDILPEQIVKITDEELDIKFDDPVWFDNNIRKPYAKMRAKELGVEYEDTGDLKRQHEEFFHTPAGIKLKKYGVTLGKPKK